MKTTDTWVELYVNDGSMFCVSTEDIPTIRDCIVNKPRTIVTLFDVFAQSELYLSGSCIFGYQISSPASREAEDTIRLKLDVQSDKLRQSLEFDNED